MLNKVSEGKIIVVSICYYSAVYSGKTYTVPTPNGKKERKLQTFKHFPVGKDLASSLGILVKLTAQQNGKDLMVKMDPQKMLYPTFILADKENFVPINIYESKDGFDAMDLLTFVPDESGELIVTPTELLQYANKFGFQLSYEVTNYYASVLVKKKVGNHLETNVKGVEISKEKFSEILRDNYEDFSLCIKRIPRAECYKIFAEEQADYSESFLRER